MSEMINVKIDNIPVTVEKGTTILDAARIAGVKIPTLCYLKDINAIGYDYTSDGSDSEGYYLVIGKKK